MRRNLLLITLLLLVVIVALSWGLRENFADTSVATLNNDRTNPLATVKSGAIPVGISVGDLANERDKYKAIFGTKPSTNSREAAEGFAGAGAAEDPKFMPVAYDENSEPGLINFCKKNGSSATPFSDAKFAANCGVCVTKGVVNTLDSNGKAIAVPFTQPTGVLVYQADKDRAIADQATNGFHFPNLLPSLNAATCAGASAGGDSEPVLAINQGDLDAFKKRIACREGKAIGNECGLCVSPNVYSYVPANGDINPLTLVLWGYGAVTLAVGGQEVRSNGAPGPDASGNMRPVYLSEDAPLVYTMGIVPEGTSIEVEVSTEGTARAPPPFVYGVLVTKNSTASSTVDGIYKLAMDKFIETDKVSNSFPRYGAPKNFTYTTPDKKTIKPYLKQIRPSPRSNRMKLIGSIPVTLVQKDQLASYDCPTSPMMMLQGSAEMLSDDPCVNPKGQKPGKYSEACLQGAVVSAGCSTDGSWYKNITNIVGTLSIGELTTIIKSLIPLAKTDVGVAMGCLGKNISTPCDPYVSGNGAAAVPNRACLIYTYKNLSEGSRVGRSYRAATAYSSLNGKTIQFCQSEGALNPEKPSGESRLIAAAQGYNGKVGLEAVRTYISDIYTKASGSLDINKLDKDGGRKDSWNDCFGIPIADPVIGNVRVNSAGTVQSTQDTCSTILPLQYTPTQNTLFGTVSMASGDYILAFKIKPTAVVGNWANIIRFQSTSVWGGDCCTPGQRSPSIWFFPGAFNLHVRIGDQTDGNWGINTNPIPLNQVSSVRLECRGRNVMLTVNDQVYSATQPTARARGTMRVYGSDPWYQPARAEVAGLCYTGL